jgi:hypothetical protein
MLISFATPAKISDISSTVKTAAIGAAILCVRRKLRHLLALLLGLLRSQFPFLDHPVDLLGHQLLGLEDDPSPR